MLVESIEWMSVELLREEKREREISWGVGVEVVKASLDLTGKYPNTNRILGWLQLKDQLHLSQRRAVGIAPLMP